MTLSKIQTLALCALLLGLSSKPAAAFEFFGNKWRGATAEYYVNMQGVSATQLSWNSAFIRAMDEWSEQTLFNFTLVEENKNPCSADGFSSVDFNTTFCGSSFGNNVLAVTVRRFVGQTLGPANIDEADIIVNQQQDFDIFDGPLIQFGQSFNGVDFGRVALHELGHAIGLDHEDSNNIDAIMAPTISNIFELQQDDIDGVNALYSGLSKCEIATLSFGAVSDALNANDCKVSELTAGGGDDSFLDLYRFDVSNPITLDFSVTSDALDAVLLVATTELDYLATDAFGTDDCDSELTITLDPGSYFLIVNTFDQQIKEECGTFGSYQLRTNFAGPGQPFLGANTSLLGSFNFARYSGGISADNGQSFSNVFKPTDSLDISAEITIDVRHRGEPGFLVVAALIEDQILMLNSQGEFVDVTPGPLPPVQFASKVLATTEAISIASDLVPAELGIEQIEANIVVGYGLDSNPGEIFYHQTPLNLTVQAASPGGD